MGGLDYISLHEEGGELSKLLKEIGEGKYIILPEHFPELPVTIIVMFLANM